MQKTCTVTGQLFEVSDAEMAMRKKLDIEGEPTLYPIYRFMQLAAFWQHWNFSKRKCEKTGKDIISPFSEDCPFPVWHKDEWVKNAEPPEADFDDSKEVFPQMWEFFHKSPIAHSFGTGCENCEYTDDWWFSRNCYLSHSGAKCEDVRYCYRVIGLKNCQFCVFSFESELCRDLINCHNCFQVRYAYNCLHCTDSAFLYDCRNCNNCFLSSNLRNKEYYFMNKQYTKEEYEQKMAEWDLQSRATYERATQEFKKMLLTQAWHRALYIEQCENCTGNYLENNKDCTNCYFISDAENCINSWRGGLKLKDLLDCVSPAFNCELTYYSSMVQSQCYDAKFCCNIIECQYMEYCMHCFQCKNCFGCCGLSGKEYYIFNKKYSPEEYKKEKARIIEAMKKTGEYGQFFPGHFAACPYNESLAGFYWPLDEATSKRYGFWYKERTSQREASCRDASEIPDRSNEASEELEQTIFWDSEFARPFQVQVADIEFANKIKTPLNNTYFAQRLQENFRMIPFDGNLRTIQCTKCGTETETGWSKEYNERILCEECYFKEVY